MDSNPSLWLLPSKCPNNPLVELDFVEDDKKKKGAAAAYDVVNLSTPFLSRKSINHPSRVLPVERTKRKNQMQREAIFGYRFIHSYLICSLTPGKLHYHSNPMIRLIHKELHYFRPLQSNIGHVYLLSTSTVKPTVHTSNSTDSQSLTLSFLLNSCRLSLKSANLASKKLQIDATAKADTVLKILRTYGLTQTHIKNLITSRPLVLLADPHKTLIPNFELLGKLGFGGINIVKVLNKYPKILEADVHTIVEFFRTYGFSDMQIASLTLKRPSLFMYNAQKCFKPKIEFFESLGFSREEIAHIFSSVPYLLERSLENRIIPSVEVLSRYGTVLKMIKSCYRILEFNLEEVLVPNMAMLMEHGVPKSNALKLIMLQPKSLLLRNHQFAKVVKEVKELGFNPTHLLFILAIRSIAVMSKSLWERKMVIYRSFGLSDDEILAAFRLQPMCMMNSEKKIKKLLDFYMNELKMTPSTISKNPSILLLSLEKRIIPRCSVLQLLMSKGQIKRKISIAYAFRMTERMFLHRFVSKYQLLIPEVVEAHQGKILFEGFPQIPLEFNM